MKLEFFKTLSLVAVVSAALCGCSAVGRIASQGRKTAVEDLTVLTIGTADSGGTMYPAGKAIAQVIGDSDQNIKLNISASKGSINNVKTLNGGDIDLGLVSGDIAFAAMNGTGEFEDEPVKDLRVVAAVYSSLSNWIAPASLGIEYVHDLKGKHIGIGPQDSTTELSARISLAAAGITDGSAMFKNCGLGSGADEIKAGTLDAVHGFTGIPVAGFSRLSDEVPCTVLQYTKKELSAIIRENSFYYQDVIPAGTYKGQEADVDTFGIKCLLCVRADMDEKLVYELTSILYQNRDAMAGLHPALSSMSKDGFMFEDLPIPLHPGAERFYQGLKNVE